jgi:hypothetical protein
LAKEFYFMATSPVLDLLTERDRHFIEIDHITYEFRDIDDFSLSENTALTRLGARMEALEGLEEPNAAQDAEYEALTFRLCGLVLVDMPEAVILRLRRVQRVAVLRTFIGLSTSSLLRMRVLPEAAIPSNGRKPSPVSSGSTETRPRTGPPKRRPGSSART